MSGKIRRNCCIAAASASLPLHGDVHRAARDARRAAIRPTGKPFDVIYSTAARWRDGKIIEEYERGSQ
jgi:hypothetical protein